MIDVRAVGDGEMEMRLRSTSSSSSSGDDVMKWCRAPVHEVDGTCTVSAMHIHSAGSHQPCVTGSVQPTRASLSSTDLRAPSLLRSTELRRRRRGCTGASDVPLFASFSVITNTQQYAINKKRLKNFGPIRHCELPHCYSPGVANVARRLRIDVHDNNDYYNA